MARLALAIDSGLSIWDLVHGCVVEPAVAQVLATSIGHDVLIYRVTDMQGGYYGVVRLLSIGVGSQTDGHLVHFDTIRMFAETLPYPVGVTMLTRLQMLDDDEFEAIVESGRAVAVPAVLMEPTRPFVFDAPDIATVEAVIASIRRETQCTCAFTGEIVEPDNLQVAPIWAKGIVSGLRADNLLALCPEADLAFRAGHFSGRDDESILVDSGRIDRALLARLNPSGRLVLPANTAFHPAAENLAFHRRFVFGLE